MPPEPVVDAGAASVLHRFVGRRTGKACAPGRMTLNGERVRPNTTVTRERGLDGLDHPGSGEQRGGPGEHSRVGRPQASVVLAGRRIWLHGGRLPVPLWRRVLLAKGPRGLPGSTERDVLRRLRNDARWPEQVRRDALYGGRARGPTDQHDASRGDPGGVQSLD